MSAAEEVVRDITPPLDRDRLVWWDALADVPERHRASVCQAALIAAMQHVPPREREQIARQMVADVARLDEVAA